MANALLLQKINDVMCTTLLASIASPTNEIKLVEVKSSGAYDMDLLFLEGDVTRLENHANFGNMLSGANSRGQDWLQGLLSAPDMGVTQFNGQHLIGSVRAGDVMTNSALADWDDVGYQDAVIAQNAIVMSSVHASCLSGLATEHAAAALSTTPYMRSVTGRPHLASGDEALRDLARKFSYPVLDDVPSHIFTWYAGNYGFPPLTAGTNWPASTFPWGNAYRAVPIEVIHRAGVDYVVILVYCAVAGGFDTTYSVLWCVPVQKSTKSWVPFLQLEYGFNQNTYKFKKQPSPLSDDLSVSLPLDINAFFDVPAAYKTDVLNRVRSPADVDHAWSLPSTLLARRELRDIHRATFMPLLAPPGDAFYLLRGNTSAEVTVSTESLVVGVGESAVTYSVITSSIAFDAERCYSAIPQSWYETYYSTGFGFFKGKGIEAAQAKSAAMSEMNGMVHTAVWYDSAMAVPTDLVSRTTTYLSYKKAREKACLTNDFMEQKYDGKQTWAQVNDKCNKLGTMNVTYGYRDSLPSVAVAFEDVILYSYRVNAAVQPYQVYETFNGGVETTVVFGNEEVIGRIAAGAPISGSTFAALKTSWGFTDASVLAALDTAAAEGAEWRDSVDPAFRGTSFATHDYAWESIGVSGFPDLRSLTAQAGFRSIIVSAATIEGRTANLHRAFLLFADRSRVNALL